MPRDLPGLYWDEERQRYFPVSARPASQARAGPSTIRSPILAPAAPEAQNTRVSHEPSSSSQDANASPRRKRRKTEQHPGSSVSRSSVDQGLKTCSTYTQIQRQKTKLMSHNLACLSEGKPFWHGDFAFSCLNVTTRPDGSFVASTGDKGGWLQTYCTDKLGYPYGGSRELYLGSEVTAVCRSDTHRLAVSFGPSSKIAVENIVDDAEIWNIISIGDHRCHDVRSAHLLGRSLVLGAAKRGILLSDIQAGWSFDILPTGSDVMAICQLENVVYTGSRNGSIQCFDKRLRSRQKGQELFDGRFREGNRSITHLSVLNGTQMVASTIKGELELLDLRFAGSAAPVMEFTGHVNTYSAKLGIATSPCSSYLFAAGQDNRIRAWSLLTGELIAPLRSTLQLGEEHTLLLRDPLPDPITAIEVTEGGGGGGASANGMTLWAACEKRIHRFWLGQRLGEGVRSY